MKIKINQLKIVGFLSFACLCFAFNFGIAAMAAAQEKRRETIVEKAAPIPIQTPTVAPKVAPTIIPTTSPTPVQIQTVADLQSKIRHALSRPDLQRGQVGVKIASLDTNQTIFEQNAEKYFMPASNMKSYTVAAALEKLSPDFRFVTSVFAHSAPDANGIIKGDLTVFGRGDVSFSTAFYDGDYYKGLTALAEKIAGAGVKRIEGNLVGDESYFRGNPIPESWEWDDLQWYYGAEISALPVNDNAVDLKITPNSQLGMPCIVTVSPANSLFTIVNLTQTISPGNERAIEVIKKLNLNVLEIRGTMPLDDKGYTGYIALTKPSELFVALLKNALQQKGVVIAGQTRTIDYKVLSDANRPPSARDLPILSANKDNPPVEIARFESPPFSLIAAKTMKPSQNTYTETILWTLGERIGRQQELTVALDEFSIRKLQKASSAELGIKTVQKFLTEIGIASDSVIQWDGSGLSRHNLITPASAVQLYTFMSKSRYAAAWRDSLTIGGVDGTLRNRFKGTVAAGNVRGKTGTIDQVSSLSGYVTTAAGERLVFSILVNGVNDVGKRQAAIDEIVIALANFNGSLK